MARPDPAPALPVPRAAVPTLPAQLLTPVGDAAAGPPIPVRLTAAMPSGAPPASASPPPAAGAGLPAGATLPAESAGPDALGRPLLHAAGGVVLRLAPGAVDLPPGARLSVTFPEGLPPPPAERPRGRRADPMRVLTDLLGAADVLSGEAARTPPQADTILAARLLRLHHAIRGADASLLLPDDGAADGEPEGAPAVREAVAELARLAREPLPGGWRATLLPVLVDGEPEPLRLYVRDGDDPPPRGAVDEDRPRRAVFDLTLTRLGRLQLDALCRGSRFDLLVRSERALPPELHAEIMALYAAATEVAGLHGWVGFRPGGLLPLPDPRTPSPIAVTA